MQFYISRQSLQKCVRSDKIFGLESHQSSLNCLRGRIRWNSKSKTYSLEILGQARDLVELEDGCRHWNATEFDDRKWPLCSPSIVHFEPAFLGRSSMERFPQLHLGHSVKNIPMPNSSSRNSSYLFVPKKGQRHENHTLFSERRHCST